MYMYKEIHKKMLFAKCLTDKILEETSRNGDDLINISGRLKHSKINQAYIKVSRLRRFV